MNRNARIIEIGKYGVEIQVAVRNSAAKFVNFLYFKINDNSWATMAY